MAENDEHSRQTGRHVDVVTLLTGLATLAIAGYVLSDGAMVPAGLDLHWLLSGGAITIGVVLLISSLRRGS
ncbi:hypothetical protein SAMN06265360_10432 [Haloechinothrix alba]|uniref:Uncharacterized protein n=1 Tax=Haloechinothrix alba TaxID=664784 RepID=A0A238VT04_9PSEU|nr:hypothetical protein [Haloechinothrix alba]SNR37445.1 hypothetical protein SAMN06265360_10432 [Haloechinothrix alba]